MLISMQEKTKEKLNQLQKLIGQKEAIERKIEAILSPEKVVALPPDFSFNSEVLALIKDAGSNGIAATSILAVLTKKYPDYGIDRKKLASSLAYLKNSKKQIDSVTDKRGVYKLVENQKQ